LRSSSSALIKNTQQLGAVCIPPFEKGACIAVPVLVLLKYAYSSFVIKYYARWV
jgi:hypothetical protein